MPLQKQIADLLTASRVLLALSLPWLGFKKGTAGLSSAVWLVVLSWTSDILDGPLARRSRAPRQTWVGDHDLQADMVFAVGLLVYLALAGLWSPLVATVYLLIWALVFRTHALTKGLGSLFQTAIYGSFIWIALRQAPADGRWLVVWIVAAIVATWPRFPRELVPDFLADMRKIATRRQRPQNQ